MSKTLISVGLSILSGTAVAFAAASCGSSGNGGGGDSGSDATSSSGGSSGGGSSSGASSSSSGGGSSSSSGGSSSSGAGDAGDAGGGCKGTAAGQTLIDDMSAPTGTAIRLMPPSCAQQGTWFDYPGAGGGTINPTPFAFSSVPAGLPADAGVSASDAGSPDAAASDGGDGGRPGPKAACVNGATGTAAYSSTGMGFNLATVPNPDGGFSTPVPIDASSHTGIQFWAWGAGDAGMQSVTVQARDKYETPGLGVCDPSAGGSTACGASQKSETFVAGWQLIQIPFLTFAPNPGYGDANEPNMALDSSSLTQIQWQVQLASPDGGAPVPFNFCVYNVSFY
jgi:hypothetical protein